MPPVPKPPPRAREVEQLDAEWVAWIGQVRAIVLNRDRVCRRCGCRWVSWLEMHEIQSRAMLRGRPKEEIFNTANCVMLCGRCHWLVTTNRIEVVVEQPDLGADGPLTFRPKESKAARWARLLGRPTGIDTLDNS